MIQIHHSTSLGYAVIKGVVVDRPIKAIIHMLKTLAAY